mgnify:FL=1
MLNFMVNAEGGLTTAGYAICIVLGIVVFGIALFFAGKIQKKIKCPRNSLRAVHGNGTCFYYFLYQDFLSAMGRQCDAVQHALYRAGSKLVWSKNRNSGWIYIWNAPVFTGAIRTFSVPGML